MTLKYLRATGNWSANATWSLSSGGPADTTPPDTGDTAVPEGGFILTVDDANRKILNILHGAATVTFAAGSKLTFDNDANAYWNLGHDSAIITDAIAINGTYAEVTSAGGLDAANKWKFTIGSNKSPTITTQNVFMTGCQYGLLPRNDTFVTFMQLTLRQPEFGRRTVLVKQRPLGGTAAITRWMGVGEMAGTVDMLFDSASSPFLLVHLSRLKDRNKDLILITDRFQGRVFIESMPKVLTPEMVNEWITLGIVVSEG